MNSKLHPRILAYMEMVEQKAIRACEEQHLLMAHVRKCFETEDIRIDSEQLDHYLSLAKYFPFEQAFEWQEFVLGLHLCAYRSDGMPRWPDLLCELGRGAGKDGTIAWESLCLLSPYNGIRAYDVDICANNEDQAMRPVRDVVDALEKPFQIKKLKKHFYWTKEKVVGIKTNSTLKGHTNSPKGKDGLRSGAVIFNEIHQYENYANINVFTTGLGKKKHPRRSYYTTNGDVRDGPLDDMLEKADGILRNGDPDNGLLPFICKLNCKKDVHDPDNWEMANPSLRYLPTLTEEIRKEYLIWKSSPHQLPAFMTKRMNIPDGNSEIEVTKWENLEAATALELPDMTGWMCVVGIDYAKLNDFAAVNFHFRKGPMRYDICHAWLCLQSPDLRRIKAPWEKWRDMNLLTAVDDVEISPDLIVDYIAKMGQTYAIQKIAMDDYRYTLLAEYLKKIGFDHKDYKNVYRVKKSDIMKVVPVVDSIFNNHNFSWGDNPMLRWATNNTKLVRASRNIGSDTGNFYYAKIEAKSRKTDPFMGVVASVVIEAELGDGTMFQYPDLGIITG